MKNLLLVPLLLANLTISRTGISQGANFVTINGKMIVTYSTNWSTTAAELVQCEREDCQKQITILTQKQTIFEHEVFQVLNPDGTTRDVPWHVGASAIPITGTRKICLQHHHFIPDAPLPFSPSGGQMPGIIMPHGSGAIMMTNGVPTK